MSDSSVELGNQTKSSRLSLLIGLFLAVFGAAAGYFAVANELIQIVDTKTVEEPAESYSSLPDFQFVELDPIVISLRDGNGPQHLRFAAQLEVDATEKGVVEEIRPRIVDVLNGYLRALELADLRDPLALTRLRSQMLRRVQIVAGGDRVKDILIMEFVLN